MPDNRLTLTIEAQNLAQAAFKQFQTDVRQSNEALQKTGQAGRQSSTGIKVYRDELGRFHDAVTGRYVSAARLLKEGFTEVERGADDSTEAIKRANPAIARMRREFDFLRNDIHNAAGVFRQFSTAIQSQIRVQVNAAANLERLRVGLDTISGSSAAAELQYRRLVEVSRYPGINIENSLRASLQLQALRKSGEEAVEVVREFGNALALSGTAPRELNQVVNAIKQLSGEGKILQEDIAIITTRVARLVPELQDAFGGSRAKDVREFFDALGVDESDQADQFLRIVLDRLAKLPRAGDTAANAIENLNDTTDRLQASIGANFLPIVREATGRLEKFLQEIERDPQATRNIAILEALGGTFLTVTAAGLGFAAALPAVAAGLAFLATNPIGLTIVAVAALTAGLVALKVASQDVETQVERLATTFDELDEVLRANHEAIQSNQQAQVESARSSLTIQRDAIQGHITLLEEERASIEKSIEANRKRAEQGLLPIASTGESFGTQLDNANARLEVTQQRLQEVNDALRANEEASVPIQKAKVNIDTLTKAVTRLKAELEEETTFEGISQSVTGDPAGFRSSAQALADIETLLRVNVDRFKELREAAASGNQEAATALSKLNQQFEGLRDTQADRHIDNISAAFDELNQSTNVTSSQLADVLQATQAFVNVFQGTGGLIQDDVARATELIDDIQARLNSVRREEQLPKTERQRRRSQADEEPESQIEQIREQRQAELEAQVEVARQLFQIRKDIREAENQAEIDAAEEQATALLRVNGRFVSQFIELRGLITDEAIAQAERLRDQSLSRLSGEVEERQALYEDDLKAQRQVEQAKRQENENTYDFDAYLAGLRTKNRQEAAQDLIRLEERALDASSSRQLEALTRDTQQFVDAYAQRGNAFRDLVADAQELGGELQEAFDLTEQQKRLEDFQDSVAGVLDNLAGIAIDHIFDSFSDSAQRATDAVGTFVDEVRGELQLLQNDITRLTRFDEDQGIRRERLEQDRDRRLVQLQRERQTIAARAPVGDQASLERNVQRRQDISARISALREDFAVRLSRFDEDRERRRDRTIEDATQRRENFENRGTDDSLVSKLVGSLTNSLSNTLSSTISTAIASALGGALSGQFTGLIDAIKGLFGGGASTTPTPALPTPTPDTGTSDDTSGRITLSKDDITPPAEAIDLQGAVSLALSDITAPVEAVALKGAISLALTDITAPVEAVPLRGDITEITVSAVPPIIYLKGVVNELMVDSTAAVPAPIGLGGIINKLTTDPAAEVPQVNPAAVVRSVIVDPSAEIPAVNPSGVINSLEIGADTQTPVVNPAGVIRSLSVSPDAVTPEVNPDGVIRSLSIDPTVPPLTVDMRGNVSELIKSFTEPIPLQATADVTLNIPDTDLLPPIDLGGLRFTNVPNVPLRFTPDTPQEGEDGTSDEDTDNRTPAGKTSTDDDGTGDTGTTTADVVANEGRRDKVFGTGNPTVQTSISSEELAQALAQGQRASQEGTGFFNPATALAEGLQSLVNAVLSSGVSVGGDGVSLGADAGGLTDAQVEALAASLGQDLDSSFRSDFIPTLLGNQPGTVQPGDADHDDNTAQAPAAARFNQAAASISAVADVLTVEALANVAQEATLVGVSDKLDSIRLEAQRIADQPIVSQLRDAGVLLPQTLEDRTNSFLPDVLSQGGLNQFANLENADRNLALMQDLQANAQPADLSQMPGTSEGTPMYAHIVNQPPVQDVRVVNEVDVKGEVNANVKGTVDVKQVGVVQVSQSGEWVMRLASGETIPVYVQGGSVQANLSQGGISTLAELIDVENQRRDAFNTAI